MSEAPGGFSRRAFLAVGGALLGPQAVLARTHETADTGAPGASVAPAARANVVRTGGARTVRVDGEYNVWVKQVGPEPVRTGQVPVLTLHGGPGFNHFYLECLEDFLPQAGIRYWYYDQLGCGFSDTPSKDSLWRLDRYRDEVEQVRRALGLERIVLFGHSWGGLLAMEYALQYPQHLSGLVISNMTASVAEYVKYAEVLLAQLPPAARATIQRHRAARDYDSPEYQKVLLEEVYARHVCRLDPWPEPLQRAFRTLNPKIYNTMQGPDEFTIVGNLKNWDLWGRLHAIQVPTLLIGARHDEMSPEQIRRMGTLIPHSRVAICENGSHMAMYDDQQAYFAALLPFLHQVGAGQRS
ncbi:MAG TPA: proline iminopeptidase-family hydrolase [Steroidobacteraceae bacterium]|nr:proline iminopeptidase-family hydrolase [Steroidobacteraceae bacterium]